MGLNEIGDITKDCLKGVQTGVLNNLTYGYTDRSGCTDKLLEINGGVNHPVSYQFGRALGGVLVTSTEFLGTSALAAVSVPATATPAATVSWAGTVAASAETAKSATMTTKEVILFVKEASKALNSSGGGSGNKPNPSKTEKSAEGGSKEVKIIIDTRTSMPPKKGRANSIYEQLNPDGTVKSRAFYEEKGNPFSRQEFDYPHFDKKTQQSYQPHEHNYKYNQDGLPAGKSDCPLPSGYNNKATIK